jgi:hypothetical protein
MDEETARGYEVVYREAVRALDFQRNAFDALRARVGYLLSAATIATSFLGGLALRDHSDEGSWIAIGLFVGFGAFALRLLWPRAEGAEASTVTWRSLQRRHMTSTETPTSSPSPTTSGLRSPSLRRRSWLGLWTWRSDKMRDVADKPEPRGGTNPMRPYPGDEKRPK